MKVKSKEGVDYIGNLVSVNSNDIELEWISHEKKKPVGKGKIDVKKNKLIAFDQIEKANLIVNLIRYKMENLSLIESFSEFKDEKFIDLRLCQFWRRCLETH